MVGQAVLLVIILSAAYGLRWSASETVLLCSQETRVSCSTDKCGSPIACLLQLDIFVNFITGAMTFNSDTGLYETSYDLVDTATKYAK